MNCSLLAACMPPACWYLALLITTLASCYLTTAQASSEHLLFHELNDGIVAVTAAFSAHRTGGSHETTFPRSISSLLDSFPVQELNLTLTRGRWREEWCGTAAKFLACVVGATVFCAAPCTNVRCTISHGEQ